MQDQENISICVIGIGNEYRQDDAAGLLVVRKLEKTVGNQVEILEQGGEASSLITAWGNSDRVILIDAVQSGARPGTIHRVDATNNSLTAGEFRCSSHLFGVAESIELARTLDQLPPKLIVYGIEGKQFEHGVTLSPEVDQILDDLADRVLEEISLLKTI